MLAITDLQVGCTFYHKRFYGLSTIFAVSRGRVLMFVGRYSMAIYLLHDPVVKYCIFRLLLDQEAVSTLLLAAAATLVLAMAVTRLIEEPLRKVAHNVLFKSRTGTIIY